MLRRLTRSEIHLLTDHLLRLPKQDRYFRFAGLSSDEVITSYVSTIDLDTQVVFAHFDNNLKIVAASHVAISNGTAEIALSVDPEYRGKGLGSKLFDRSILWSKNNDAKEVFTFCLSRNTWMMRKARSAGMIIDMECGEAEAKLILPRRNIFSVFLGVSEEQFGVLDYSLKKQVKNINDLFSKTAA